jgi:hypothetical protein
MQTRRTSVRRVFHLWAAERAQADFSPWDVKNGGECGAARRNLSKTNKAQKSALQALKIGYNGVLLLLNFERFFSKQWRH